MAPNTRRHLRARRTSRRRTREGAALVQALLVSIITMVIFACVIMFARTYGAKIGSGVIARQAAWTAGGQGCPDGVQAGAGAGSGIAQQPNANASGQTASMMSALFKLSPAKPVAGDTAADAPVILGGERIAFQTVTQFSCNEEPDPTGDLVSIANVVFDLLGDMFGS